MIWVADFLKAVPWRLILAATLVAVVAVAGWRVTTWRQGWLEAGTLREQLAAEVACEPSTACQRRAQALADQARAEAEAAALAALERLQAAEAAARADAAAWRRRYQAALATDPTCAAWAAAPIGCPL